MAGQRRYLGWPAAAALLAIAGALAWWGWRIDTVTEPRVDAVPTVLPVTARQLPDSQTFAAGSHEPAPPSPAAQSVTTDPVGSAPDLKRVFDDYITSGDPRQRRMAVQAFEACVPAFLPTAGQPPSPEPLIYALPAAHQTEREGAYRTLFARCHRLVAEGRASLDSTRQTLELDPQSQSPGRRAQEAALAGRLDRIEPLVGEALSRSDPAAVASLAGLAARIVPWRQPETVEAATLQKAHEVDAALPWVACDLGLDCSAQSLWALQICATEGLCEGDVASRLMMRITPGTVDPGAVQQQRLRLTGLIQSGRKLGLADLLPP